MKGEQTRQTILAEAAQVFSVKGYAGTSMDDLMRATQLTKGGIYNHFANKDALALDAFDFSINMIRERFTTALNGKTTTRERLHAVTALFRSLRDDPLLEGGCPLLNTAVEADDTHPALRERVQAAYEEWRIYIMRTITRGIRRGEVVGDVSPEQVATVMMSALEGGVMLSKLYGDNIHIHTVSDYLNGYIDSFTRSASEGTV